MRRVIIERSTLASLPPSSVLPASDVIRLLDRLRIPDGLPFVVEDDGSLDSVSAVNRYLLAAREQGAYSLRSLREFHVYHLLRLLRFVRLRRIQQERGLGLAEAQRWAVAHGYPRVDLVEATREDLVAYREHRLADVQEGSWNTELGCISGFFEWAQASGLMAGSPIPRWGQRGRNTLSARQRLTRQPRFLTVPQLRLFLRLGLRRDGDASPVALRERNYSYGLVLATMGLRREEAAFLLDCEVPDASELPTSGVWPFILVGKGDRPRTVYATSELVSGLDLYRRTERAELILDHQDALRRKMSAGDLIVCEDITRGRDGVPVLRLRGRKVRVDRLDDSERSRAVRVRDDGIIEPLGLFLGDRGLPIGLRAWNTVFEQARERVAASESPDKPPAHLTVAPHILRHTYAVRMLSALMREGRRRTGDPYLLLANPVLTVMELLGHADVSTTQRYLYAAERYSDELPAALLAVSAATLGQVVAPGGGE